MREFYFEDLSIGLRLIGGDYWAKSFCVIFVIGKS